MKAYKLMRLRRDGTLGSLFIKRDAILPFNRLVEAEFIPTKGYAPRKGWHCTFYPYAPHLSTKGRVWVEVQVDGISTYDRPECQGGTWILAQSMKIIRTLTLDEVDTINMQRTA